jgi:hypothetical protein
MKPKALLTMLLWLVFSHSASAKVDITLKCSFKDYSDNFILSLSAPFYSPSALNDYIFIYDSEFFPDMPKRLFMDIHPHSYTGVVWWDAGTGLGTGKMSLKIDRRNLKITGTIKKNKNIENLSGKCKKHSIKNLI